MPQDGNKGAFSADIPEDAIAEALAAVEKREPSAGAAGVAESAQPDSEGERAAAIREDAAEVSVFASEEEKLRVELDMSQERARKVYEQLKDQHERLLRTAADHENYKKRAAREKDELLRYGNERLVKEILPVLDGLDRALALAAAPATADQPLASGVEMTRRLLEDALGRFGVKGFSARGQPFDPRVHEALMSVACVDGPPGMVVDEQQRGFFMYDRLIRPAAVVVSAAPPRAEAVRVAGETKRDGEP
ncbi:MAG: nucleotide exchange factor GrpE [Anaeromyxobacter sp. RBG_16_69_14]|nr:MAG: nucleotide exchange factor GrpE [Anaeromyxobacter sp. RBG_16_69_14]